MIGSKVDRAVCAYLIGGGCGSDASVTPQFSTATKKLYNIIVRTTDGDHDAELTGSFNCNFQIQISQSASQQPKEPNPQGKIVTMDALVDLVRDLMCLSSDGGNTLRETASRIQSAGRALATSADAQVAANNADMAEFSFTDIHLKRFVRGEPDSDSGKWMEIIFFSARACDAAID